MIRGIIQRIATATKAFAAPAHMRQAPDGFIVFQPEDAALEFAVARAKESLDVFWAKFDSKDERTDEFWLKAGLTTPNGAEEHIWISVTERREKTFVGCLVNEPVDLEDVSIGDEIVADADRISDWSYKKGRYLYGNFTTRVAMERMNPTDRAACAAVLAPTSLEPEAP